MATERTTRVGDIVGGKAPIDLNISDNITIDKIWDTARWFPGFKELHKIEVDAIWANGISDESIEPDRLLECKKTDFWCNMCGYAIIIVDAEVDPPSCEAYHPVITGTGFQYTRFSKMGQPLEVEITLKFNESTVEPNFKVQHYPCETRQIQIGTTETGEAIYSKEYIRSKPIPGGRGFFHVRTDEGLKGVQGLPKYLSLIHPHRWQYKILEAYIPFAQKMGMWFPFFGLKRNTPTNQAKIEQQWDKHPDYDKLIIGDSEDAVDYLGPTATAYDPMGILEWINTLVAKGSQMNKLMLEGDPAGYLSASETTINNWVSKLKEGQVYRRTQFLPVFKVLGGKDDTDFMDPSKPTFISLMEGLKAMREAMIDIVEPEDIVDQFNEYLEKNGHAVKLRALPKEEMINNNEQPNSEETEA